MTFNQLFEQFRTKWGITHDIIFFELVFYCSQIVKNKENFVENNQKELDFNPKLFDKLSKQYFIKQKSLAHITGHTTFCGLDFIIDKKVLSPREITQQMTQDFINSHKNATGKLLDLCCGSGCIGISIKKYVDTLNVTCIDKYWKPILNTRKNGIKHKVQLIIDCVDAIKYLNKLQSVDYLISNPPYINPNNFDNKKMFKWESKKALIAKDHGLYFYKKYFQWLNNHNFIEAWFEIGYDLVEPIKLEISNYNNLLLEIVKDKQYIIIKRK